MPTPLTPLFRGGRLCVEGMEIVSGVGSVFSAVRPDLNGPGLHLRCRHRKMAGGCEKAPERGACDV